MNQNNYPLNLPTAVYFGAESMSSGWFGGRGSSWAYSTGGKFQNENQRKALFGKEESIVDPDQVAMAKTSDGLQKVPDTEQQIDSPPESMLEGIEISETPDPLLEEPENPLANTQARIQPLVPQ
tara:strand:- start:937 stop:1308 length:372 start_codon:yes stop_codon:yes gene_type:complete